MISTLGKDRDGKYWFKSDQFLTNITTSTFFFVRTKGWFKKSYLLFARRKGDVRYYNWDQMGYRYRTGEINQLIGIYTSPSQASMALEQVMKLLEITPL